MESLYDYGSRAGFWRYHRLFTSRKVPITVFAVGMVRITQHLYSFPCPKVFHFRSLAEYIYVYYFESFRPRQLILLVAHEQTGVGTQSGGLSRIERNDGLGGGITWIPLD